MLAAGCGGGGGCVCVGGRWGGCRVVRAGWVQPVCGAVVVGRERRRAGV